MADKTPDGFLAVELGDIVRVFGERGHQLQWFMHDLEAVGDVSAVWPAGILNLEERTAEPEGLKMTWSMLCRLAGVLEQTINGVLRGRNLDDDILQIEIEAFDSSYWTVTARNESFLSELRRTFLDTEEVVPFAEQ